MTLPEQGIVLEADGLSHFARTTGQPLGSTALKRRHLELLGWRVVSVSLGQWERVIGLEERRRFLQVQAKLMPRPPFYPGTRNHQCCDMRVWSLFRAEEPSSRRNITFDDEVSSVGFQCCISITRNQCPVGLLRCIFRVENLRPNMNPLIF